MMNARSLSSAIAVAAGVLTAAAGIAGAATSAPAADPAGISVEVLVDSDRTVLEQPFTYPAGKARMTALIVTLPPGAILPRHRHPVPVFGYVLEGAITVSYGDAGARTYRAGDSLIEAFQTPHSGRNPGPADARILAVYAGAVGVPGTEASD